MLCCTGMVMAQSIDFNLPQAGQETLVEEPGYVSWNIPHAASDTKTLDNGLTITIAAAGNADILRS